MNPHPFPAGKLPHAFLGEMLRYYTHGDPRLIVPPALGEDATVIDFGDRYLVAKTDPITFASDEIGWYAVNVNANDIACMGAESRFFMATILLPEGRATPALVEAIFKSIHAAADELGIAVCGGHTEITRGIDRPIVVGQILGEVRPDRLVRSSGLRPGDALLLTKGLAIEATAIIAREKREELLEKGLPTSLIDRGSHYLTDPGISVVRDARIATGAGRVTAMHDPTEGGVATGLYELATASRVGLEIAADALPVANEAERLCAIYGLDPLGIISSGALLVGCASGDADAILAAFAREEIPAARIGTARQADFGLKLCWGSQAIDLPSFQTDEITRLFGD